MSERIPDGWSVVISSPSDALSAAASSQGAGCQRHGAFSRRHTARPEAVPRAQLSFTLMVEGADVLRVRKAIVSMGGHAVEILRCEPVGGSSRVRVCIGLEAGCEEAMSRIVRSVEAGEFGRIVRAGERI
jgi:hypothetical protein